MSGVDKPKVVNFKDFSRPNKEIKYFSRTSTEYKHFSRRLVNFKTFLRLYEFMSLKKKIWLILTTSLLTIQWYCWEKIDVGHSWKMSNLFCIIAAKLACKRGVIFSRFSGELKQARSERAARDTRHARRGKALLARFALVFTCLKLTPDLQATVKWVEERCYAFYRQRLDPVLQQLR